MFTDPVSVTYSGVAKSFPRTGNDENGAVYRLVDGTVGTLTLNLSHKFDKRNRAVARIQREALVADPLVTGQNRPESLTVTVTTDFSVLHTAADAQTLYNALLTFLTSGNFLKLAAGET